MPRGIHGYYLLINEMGRVLLDKWALLPHYSVKKQKLLFLNSIEVFVELTNEILDQLRLKKYIEQDILTDNKSRVLFEALKSRGILYCIYNQVIKKELCNNHIMIIQPHCDDFVFSCGATIAKEQSISQGFQALVVTAFSKYSFLNCPWRDKTNMSDRDYSNLRLIENELCSNDLNLALMYMNLEDAGKRSKNADNLFAHNRLYRSDQHMEDVVVQKLKLLFSEDCSPIKIYIPFAIGQHRDHLIVHNAAMKLIQDINYTGQVFLYEDYPYCDNGRYIYWERLHQLSKLYNITPVYNTVDDVLCKKINLFNYFRSQIKQSNIKEIKKIVNQLSMSTGFEGYVLGHIKTPTGKNLYERVWACAL